MSKAEQTIPKQVEGEQNDVLYYVDLPSQGEAHKLYMLAKDRLKDVGNWHKLTGAASSSFAITDTAGNVAFKMLQQGDLFYIDMPGPGPMAGGGYDWVRVEHLEEHDDAFGEEEYISINVRPVANPKHPEKQTAHFFSHTSTNTFIIEREMNRVSATVHGRNETVNTDGNLYDKARNAVVALTARHGLSGPHWQVFVEALLKGE